MSMRFAFLLAIEMAQFLILCGLFQMMRQLRRLQAELSLMVGEATNGLVDRTQQLHEVVEAIQEKKVDA
ncbi:hypothetical protein [Sphingomonas sp.]|uniref:hypothetical protein n=1 Tax=Sphingomonas sp. TaxID=28214 RepID=UPI003B3A4534